MGYSRGGTVATPPTHRKILQDLEASMMEEVVRRRQLGSYNADSGTILRLCEVVLRMVQYEIDRIPARKGK